MLRAWSSKKTWKETNFKSDYPNTIDKADMVNGRLLQQDGLTLWKHADVKIKRHTLIKPDKSPYDGDWVYWSTRRGKDIETPTRVAKLLKKQKGKCSHCGQYFQ
jgi:RNA-directed DNA polymerase